MAVVVNILVVVIVTLVLRAMRVPEGVDGTADTDYTAEREDPTFRDLPDPLGRRHSGRPAGEAAPVADRAERTTGVARRRAVARPRRAGRLSR